MKQETGIIIYIEQTVHKNNASNTVLFSHSFEVQKIASIH